MRVLCYMPNGGGGFSFNRSDIMAMGLGEVFSHIEWLSEQRKREAAENARVTRRR